MLSFLLKELESDRLMTRTQYNVPMRVECSLKDRGGDLMPVFYKMAHWGLIHVP